MIRNGGVSFGLQIPAVELVTGALIIVIIVIAIRQREWRWWLVIAGGLLNLGERLRWGTVTDYWKVPLLPIYNNLNDWLIFGGVILLIWKYYTKTK